MLALMIIGGAQTAWADNVSATLDHTAGSGWGRAAGEGYTVDSENEYYNVSSTSATSYCGAAFAQFSFTIPEGQVITSATLTWACLQYNSRTYSSDIYYLNAGTSINFETFVSDAAGSALLYTNSRTLICKTAALQGTKKTGKLHTGLTTDVTDAMKAIAAEGQNYIIFQWTNNNGSAHLKGKGDATNAPTLVITTADASSTTSYTVNFVDGSGNALKDPAVYTEQTIGESVSASNEDKASFFNEDGTMKYILTSGDSPIELVADAASNVINLVFREAAKYNYTVTNSFSETLASGETFEGETIYAVYPKYKNVDGTLYEAPKGNAGWYKCSFVPTSDNYVHTITYSATDIKNVVYFSEGENIKGAIATSAGGNMGARSSNAACGYTTSDVTIANLLPGNYQVVTYVYSNSTAGTTLNFAYGTETFTVSNSGASNGTTHPNNITITEATDLIWQASGDNKNGLDYIYIVRTGDPSISISLPADYTYSTFSSNLPLNFTGNEAVEAYIAYGDGEKVILEKVNTVPDHTGLILKKLGDATTATVPVLESVEELTAEDMALVEDYNRLVAVVDAPISAETLIGYGNAYILADDYKFSKVVKGATGELAVGKAYLEYNAIGGGSLNIKIFDGEATAIKGVEVKAAQADNAIYNLQGVRVSKPTAKGLYIINGKKHLCK